MLPLQLQIPMDRAMGGSWMKTQSRYCSSPNSLRLTRPQGQIPDQVGGRASVPEAILGLDERAHPLYPCRLLGVPRRLQAGNQMVPLGCNADQ